MKLPRMLDVDIKLHWSVFILLYIVSNAVFKILFEKFESCGIISVAIASGMVGLAVVASVLAHELGHVWAGQRLGMEFSDITLFVLGGAAKMLSQPKSPKVEFFMALAGPGCSAAIGTVLAVVSVGLAYFGRTPDSMIALSSGAILLVATVNVMLGIFNMIPAFPLDGGRVARAVVWKFTGSFVKATMWASFAGQILGWGFVGLGILAAFGNETCVGKGIGSGLWAALIGFLITVMAKKERKSVCGC